MRNTNLKMQVIQMLTTEHKKKCVLKHENILNESTLMHIAHKRTRQIFKCIICYITCLVHYEKPYPPRVILSKKLLLKYNQL